VEHSTQMAQTDQEVEVALQIVGKGGPGRAVLALQTVLTIGGVLAHEIRLYLIEVEQCGCVEDMKNNLNIKKFII
jgi:hypothetical protein